MTADLLLRDGLVWSAPSRSDLHVCDGHIVAPSPPRRGGATALGLTAYGLTEGAPADLVVVRAGSAAEAVVTRPVRELVLKAGTVVARNGRLV